MIQARALSRRFGHTRVVEGLHLDLPPGGRYALIGVNGAGKSTTLAMVTGLLKPTSGTIRIAGMDVAAADVQLHRTMGVLPERLGLFDQLTLAEHLDLVGAAHGLPSATLAARRKDLLGLFGLEAAQHRRAQHASHGMRKKTALAMALLHAPALLVLDEPFEGLDPSAAACLMEVLRLHTQAGGTLLFTSHILPVVRALATRCLMLEAGRIAWDRPVEELPSDGEGLYLSQGDTPASKVLPWFASSLS